MRFEITQPDVGKLDFSFRSRNWARAIYYITRTRQKEPKAPLSDRPGNGPRCRMKVARSRRERFSSRANGASYTSLGREAQETMADEMRGPTARSILALHQSGDQSCPLPTSIGRMVKVFVPTGR